ncbi:MAG TPA: FAD binding domain-containing protein, partial [Ktedonobacterales bacterium]|nr:FAD binding domain-containing protein [Ktedonobacterales bacterium]
MRAFEHTTADTTAAALAALQADASASQVIAGGTDLMTLIKADLLAPTRLIDIKPIRDLRYIRFAGGSLTIGAGATL